MPEVDHTPGGFSLEPAPFTERPAPTFGETLGAGFALENDVYNAFDYAMQKTKVYQPTQGFDVVTRMKQYDVDNRSNFWDQYKDSLFGIRSEEEMFDKLGRIKQWEERRDTLSRAGWGGVVAAVGAGVVSPTALIPFIGGARGLRAAAAGAASGLVGGVAQEVPLALNQEGRGAGESAFSIAASTVVGGLLGGAIGYFRKGELARVERDMATAPVAEYGGDLGSRSYLEATDAGMLAKPNRVSGAIIGAIAETGPVTRVIDQDDLSTARHMMAQLSNAGLRQEGNASFIPGAIGGTIEDLVLTYNAKLVAAVDAVDQAHARYQADGDPPTVMMNARATLSGMLREDKLSRQEFNTEVSRALRTGDVHEIPEVQSAAQKIRTEFQDPLLKAAQEAGIFKKDVEALGDPTYLMRDYNVPAIQAATQDFINILAEHYGKRLDAEFSSRWQKFTARESRTNTLVEDLQRPADEVAALREKFLADLKSVDEKRAPELVEAEDKIDSLRSLAAQARDAGDDARATQYLKDARDMEKAAGEPLKKTRESRAELRRRLRNLTQSRASVEQRQLAKLDKIERAEDINLNALNRAARAGYRFLNQLDTLSEEAFDAELKRLRDSFAETGTAYDRGTERLGKLLNDPETYQLVNVPEELETFAGTLDLRHGYNSPEAPKFVDNYEGDRNYPDSVFGDAKRVYLDGDGKWTSNKVERYSVKNVAEAKAKFDNALVITPESLKRITKAMGIADKGPRPIQKDFPTKDDWLDAEREWEAGLAKGNDIAAWVEARGHDGIIVTGFDQRVKSFDDELKMSEITGAQGETFQDQIVAFRPSQVELGKNVPKGEKFRSVVEQLDATGKRKVLLEDARQGERFGRMNELANKIADAEDLGRGAVREIVQGQLQEVLQEISTRMERRTLRAQRLREQAEALDPKLVSKRIEDVQAQSAVRRTDFIENSRERGAEDIDLATGKASFNNYAKELATTIKDKIVGSYMRSPSVDIITEKRGPELARVLDIPSSLIDRFLENDINKVLRSQIRTLAPDIEIAKRFGTLDWGEMLAPVVDELNSKIERLSQTIKDPEKLAKETARLNQQFANHKRDLEGVLDRVRHRWGIPDDPAGLPTRLAQTVMRLNAARFLGGTLLSSVADVARPVMRYGLERVFSDGFGAMISDMKAFKANAREIKLAGGALDAVLHSRSRALADIQDDFVYGTRVEKGIEYATNKIGIIAAFDYWSSAMKQFTGVVSVAKILDSVDTVMNQTGKKGLDEATTYLASLGFDPNLTERVWNQMLRENGGAKVNGIWLPNTENWNDASAVNVFRQALVREVNNAIITPGVELPLTMNKTLPARMLFQFRSFGVSSTYKTLAAGLQQQDMAMVNGIMVSLAFGAMSYYLYAMAAGGKSYETMIAAGPGKWADEAIERSGVMGMLADAQRLGQRLPYVGKYANFSGQRSSQRSGQDLMDTVLGPSYNFATTTSRVLSGLEEPTQNTVHSARTLLPYQNLFYLRRLFDSMEEATGLPERRS